MPDYQPTAADTAPLPGAYLAEPRHLGYRDEERTRPFAAYFTEEMAPVPEHVREALLGGMSPAEYGYDVDDAPRLLNRPGHQRMETGWTRLDTGVTVVSCLTEMPGVTAAMWDWWFGWHSTDTARYKLWHPRAHRFATIGDDRSADRSLTDRQRYRDNVSYVDEYLGGTLMRLAIRFVDPTTLGFDDAPGSTHICARIGYSDLPLAVGWLVHQVRPTEGGSEMRSRFFLNHPEVLALPRHSVPRTVAAGLVRSPVARAVVRRVPRSLTRHVLAADLARDLLAHCAGEMNHLASFLPALHAEFVTTP